MLNESNKLEYEDEFRSIPNTLDVVNINNVIKNINSEESNYMRNGHSCVLEKINDVPNTKNISVLDNSSLYKKINNLGIIGIPILFPNNDKNMLDGLDGLEAYSKGDTFEVILH